MLIKENTLISGGAGVGKTYFCKKQIEKILNERRETVIVLCCNEKYDNLVGGYNGIILSGFDIFNCLELFLGKELNDNNSSYLVKLAQMLSLKNNPLIERKEASIDYKGLDKLIVFNLDFRNIMQAALALKITKMIINSNNHHTNVFIDGWDPLMLFGDCQPMLFRQLKQARISAASYFITQQGTEDIFENDKASDFLNILSQTIFLKQSHQDLSDERFNRYYDLSAEEYKKLAMLPVGGGLVVNQKNSSMIISAV